MNQNSENFDSHWNAGDLGCGELVMILREKMKVMQPGQILKLVALDKGAIEDIPAWCSMTGHRLVAQNHPDYFIERKEDRKL